MTERSDWSPFGGPTMQRHGCNRPRLISPEMIDEARERYADGETAASIAKSMGVGVGSLRNYLPRR